MTRAYFDCTYGISGDMILGALLDLGAPLDELKELLKSLSVNGWSLDAIPVNRCGIGATLAAVHVEETHHHRGLSEVCTLIRGSVFPELVKEYAIKAFSLLAEAEAIVHQMEIEEVHFHEVGALDAIIDIVGSMWGLHYLGVLGEKVTSSPISVGGGTVRAAHGVMPVPAPATLRLLKGMLTKSGPVEKEMATPTGVAILRAICNNVINIGTGLSDFCIGSIGYGAGTRELPGHTNFLRIVLEDLTLKESADPYIVEKRFVLECEIDDMTPELLAATAENLMALGALDVHVVTCMMKKSRPGMRLCVICTEDRRQLFIETILRETTSFGVRVTPVERQVLRREFEVVETPFGSVRIKLGFWGSEIIKATPEYEDCKQLAQQSNVPVSQVYASVLQNFKGSVVS